MPSKPTWKSILDANVRHIWADADGKNEVAVSPTFYADSGTPVDPETGDDLIYYRTEILA
jgi:hypothetical protein